MSASTFLGLPSYSYSKDFALLMNQVGALLSVVVVSKVFIHRFREAKVQSAYELLELKFSRGTRLIAAIFYCCHLILRSGIIIFGPALVLSKVMACSMEVTIVAMAAISITYTAFGGLKAVVLTDTIQFFTLTAGGVITIWVLHEQIPLETLWNHASIAGHTKILPDAPLGWDWIDPKAAHSVLSAILIYTVLEVAIRGCDQQFIQRYLACRETSSAIKSSFLSILLGCPAAIAFYAIGALLFAHAELSPPLAALGGAANIPANEAFPRFIMEHLPVGLKGALVAAIFAASMSSFDSAINALNNTTIVDLLNWDSTDPRSLKVAKLGALPWGLLATLAALWASQAGQSLLYQALYFTSLFTGPLLGMITLAFFRSHLHPRAVILGVCVGITLLMICAPPSFIPSYPPLFSWPYNPLVSCLGTWLGAHLIHGFIHRDGAATPSSHGSEA
jgi:SSS family solute:Na+ symporter